MVGPGNIPPRSVSTSGLAGLVRTCLTPESRSALVAQHVDFFDDRALLHGITQLSGATIQLTSYMYQPTTTFPHVDLDIPGTGRVALGFTKSLHVYPAPPQGGIGFHDMSYTLEGGWWFAGHFSIDRSKDPWRNVELASRQNRGRYFEQSASVTFASGTSATKDLLTPHLFALTLAPSIPTILQSASDDALRVTVDAPRRTTQWEPTSPSELRADAAERTGRGTTYYFRQGQPIGYTDRAGNTFRYCDVVAGENFASHAAILARQRGQTPRPPTRVLSSTEAELAAGAAAVGEPLANSRFHGLALEGIASANDTSSLQVIARRAFEWTHNAEVNGKRLHPPETSQALLSLSHLLGLGSSIYETQAYRFLWLHGCEDLNRGLYASVHDGLTHYQQLLILFGPQWVERDLQLPPEESFIARHVRGGLMVVDFGNRTIDAIRIHPWGMALPHYHRETPNGPIMMLTTDSDHLSRKLAQRRKNPPGTFPAYA